MGNIVKLKKCEHEWSFCSDDGDHLGGCFQCEFCKEYYIGEGVPDAFNQPESITDQLQIEVLRHPFTTTALTCYQSVIEINRLRAENEALKRDASWISVEDRLPENDIRVLVLRDAGKVINTSHPGHGDGRWVEVSALMLGRVFLCDMSSTGTTTHWRPLPPAPDRAMKG